MKRQTNIDTQAQEDTPGAVNAWFCDSKQFESEGIVRTERAYKYREGRELQLEKRTGRARSASLLQGRIACWAAITSRRGEYIAAFV